MSKLTFEIDRVNIRRMQRGAEAVSMKVFDDGELIGLPWMSKRDVIMNIKDHGECEAFTTALEIYRFRRDTRTLQNIGSEQ